MHCTERQITYGAGSGEVLGAVSSGRVTQREVQQLSDMVKAL
jgi:hypothetical protein